MAKGCRLDAGVLEDAVLATERRLPGAELLVINKFGKREAEGHGFVPVIAAGLELGLPVLVGVNGLNLPALRAFAGELLSELPADAGLVLAWALDACRAARHAA